MRPFIVASSGSSPSLPLRPALSRRRPPDQRPARFRPSSPHSSRATLERIATSLDGVVGYVVTDLTTNERVAARLEREVFPTASAIKLSVLYELLKQVEAGTLTLDTPTPVSRTQLVGGCGHSPAPDIRVAVAPRSRNADDDGQRQLLHEHRHQGGGHGQGQRPHGGAWPRRHPAAAVDDGRRRGEARRREHRQPAVAGEGGGAAVARRGAEAGEPRHRARDAEAGLGIDPCRGARARAGVPKTGSLDGVRTEAGRGGGGRAGRSRWR